MLVLAAITLVAVGSVAVAIAYAKHHEDISSVRRFLVGGNSNTAATLSIVASLFSVTFSCGIILFSHIYGVAFPFIVLISFSTGFFLVVWAVRKPHVGAYFSGPQVPVDSLGRVHRFMLAEFIADAMANNIGESPLDRSRPKQNYAKSLLYIIYALYAFSLLTLEFAVVRFVFEETGIMADAPLGYVPALFILCFIPFAYLYTYGFTAVLRTDVLQIVIVFAVFFVAIPVAIFGNGPLSVHFELSPLLERGWIAAKIALVQWDHVWRILCSITVGIVWIAVSNDCWIRIVGTLPHAGPEELKSNTKKVAAWSAGVMIVCFTLIALFAFRTIPEHMVAAPAGTKSTLMFDVPYQAIEDLIGFIGYGLLAFGIFAAIAAAALTTIDSYAFSITQLAYSAFRDMRLPQKLGFEINPRWMIVVSFPAAVLCSFLIQPKSLFEWVGATVMLLIILLPPFIHAVRGSGLPNRGLVRYLCVALTIYAMVVLVTVFADNAHGFSWLTGMTNKAVILLGACWVAYLSTRNSGIARNVKWNLDGKEAL